MKIIRHDKGCAYMASRGSARCDCRTRWASAAVIGLAALALTACQSLGSTGSTIRADASKAIDAAQTAIDAGVTAADTPAVIAALSPDQRATAKTWSLAADQATVDARAAYAAANYLGALADAATASKDATNMGTNSPAIAAAITAAKAKGG